MGTNKGAHQENELQRMLEIWGKLQKTEGMSQKNGKNMQREGICCGAVDSSTRPTPNEKYRGSRVTQRKAGFIAETQIGVYMGDQ